jgi:hypothetical protein
MHLYWNCEYVSLSTSIFFTYTYFLYFWGLLFSGVTLHWQGTNAVRIVPHRCGSTKSPQGCPAGIRTWEAGVLTIKAAPLLVYEHTDIYSTVLENTNYSNFMLWSQFFYIKRSYYLALQSTVTMTGKKTSYCYCIFSSCSELQYFTNH